MPLKKEPPIPPPSSGFSALEDVEVERVLECAEDLAKTYTEDGILQLAKAYLAELEAYDPPDLPSVAQSLLRKLLGAPQPSGAAPDTDFYHLRSGYPPMAVVLAFRMAKSHQTALIRPPRNRFKERVAAAQRRASTLVDLRNQRQDDSLKDLIFISRYLVAMSLPYSPTKDRQVVKSARLGDGRRVHMQINADIPGVDLPFGSDRTLLHWLLDQIARQVLDARQNGASEDALEHARFVHWESASSYLRDMGLSLDSGKNYADLRARYRRLAGLSIGLRIEGPTGETLHNIPLIERADLPSSIDMRAENAGQQRLGLVDLDFGVLFSRRLVAALMESAVPFPKDILRKTRKQSQMQDYWIFLAWRSYGARSASLIPWSEVQEQLWQQDQTVRRIKTRFKEAIQGLRVIWPELQAEAKVKGLWVSPPKDGVQLIGRGSELKRLPGTALPGTIIT